MNQLLENTSLDDNYILMSVSSMFEGLFSIDWIEDLTGKKPSEILYFFEKFVQDGIMTKESPGYYKFASRTRDSLYNKLTGSERDYFNRQIVNTLKKETFDDNLLHILSIHLRQIVNNEDDCRILVLAGDAFLRHFDSHQALLCYTKALDDLSNIKSRTAELLFIETAIKYSKISTARHDTDKVLNLLQKAFEFAVFHNAKSYQSLLEMHLAKNEYLRSRYSCAMGHFRKGWDIAQSLHDPKLLSSAKTFNTFFLVWQGRFKEAVRCYEKYVPDIEKNPKGRFPLLAGASVGHSYVRIGYTTQGLGMLDGIRNHCLEKGDYYIAAQAGFMIGLTMLDILRIDDALFYIKKSVQEANESSNHLIFIMGKLAIAYIYFLKDQIVRSKAYLQEFLQFSSEVNVTVQIYPFILTLAWAMAQKKYPRIPGINISDEIERMICDQNIFMKGVAFRYKALYQQGKHFPNDAILASLKSSYHYLLESGHKIELAMTCLELARHYLVCGDKENAIASIAIPEDVFSKFNEQLIPDDLRPLFKKSFQKQHHQQEILSLGKAITDIDNYNNITQYIISYVNSKIGAERGAIFFLTKTDQGFDIQLRASKNITPDQIDDISFSSTIDIILKVAETGKFCILGMDSDDGPQGSPNNVIRSRIFVPIKLRNRIIGVLYHDNRLLPNVFKESDLAFLNYAAVWAAFALENITLHDENQKLIKRINEENIYYDEKNLHDLNFDNIVGKSDSIMKVLSRVNDVADKDTTVLVLGGTGVGKELVARAIHNRSPRADKPFIRVDCSAYPESLISSELFGHERGAFTGATGRRIGRFELADGGTIFLDEIGELSSDVQVRLLRVLQSKEFERIGGSETFRSDFRLIAATNRDLEKEVEANSFRADLFYRLNVFPIKVPPLRERKDDIPLLARYFLKKYSAKMGKSFEKIPTSEMDKLIRYDWPGNVRELENIIERGTILSSGTVFRVPELESDGSSDSQHYKITTLMENERKHILWALHKTGWKISGPGGAADLLDIHPSTLSFRIKKHGINRPSKSTVYNTYS